MMKLEKFKEKKNKKKGIIIFTISCILLITGVFFYQSFALFETRENFNFIEGQVQDPGDLYFAYYVEDVLTYDMPSKDSGYTLSNKSSCTNGVTIEWDDEKWMAKVYYENYQKENNSRVKCTLYFEEKVIPPSPSDAVKDYIIAKAPEGTLIEDDGTVDHNMRYIGANPKNYVYFNCDDSTNPTSETCELWRIIGVMNNIDDGTGTKETRLKIIRNESIGKFSWDTSVKAINRGYGITEWSQADAMKLMNPGYESESVGGSLYWNRGSGTCYNNENEAATNCDFSTSGLKVSAKTMIGEAVWHTGSDNEISGFNTLDFYTAERSNNIGKICTNNEFNYCNDTVERTTKWTGYIGLMYPSDYGYATSGGITTSRETCLNDYLRGWTDQNNKECKYNTWLKKDNLIWTITPYTDKYAAYQVFVEYSSSIGNDYYAKVAHEILPTLYLKSNVQITSGEGTTDSPFQIALSE